MYFYDDGVARAFAPFALTRPGAELRAGALLVRERWTRVLGLEAAGFLSAPALAGFDEPAAPGAAEGVLPAGSIVVNARCAPALDARADARAGAWRCAGRLAAVRLATALPADAFADGTAALDSVPIGGDEAELAGWWHDAVWDYVGYLGAQLARDLPVLGAELDVVDHPGVVLGAHPVFAERGATVEPYAVFDTAAGPVVLRRGASVQAFTRVVGPCYVGESSMVTADRISGCAIGDHCKVHGEISASVLIGHANKSHDGFVGHSYLGRWVNLGAGTTTSNLKNTYGTVALWTPGGVRDTGLQFLGTLFGDHAKTGIGLTLTTGTVVGAGANVYDRMPPKAVAPFAWGGGPPYDTYDAERFVRVAERVMARRHQPLSAGMRGVLARAHARRANG
ncbi:MAG TPA: putative sugar nucleotidyl transferase [Gemmatirosa sp.]